MCKAAPPDRPRHEKLCGGKTRDEYRTGAVSLHVRHEVPRACPLGLRDEESRHLATAVAARELRRNLGGRPPSAHPLHCPRRYRGVTQLSAPRVMHVAPGVLALSRQECHRHPPLIYSICKKSK
ncbi:hypothetical protein EVAR_98006_1 [Eumeta japonica]|uniref:Uncharacterized protein n=1 Tax=Eumeta variegata TaxID=151549 RepID=A0A4C1WL11_EUMVA|nr:hypothetical protein EVAR_98006_1 [Eumeta japonica]